MSVRRFLEHRATRHRGLAAEEVGVAWLRSQGYRVQARNVTYRSGEIDVVAVEKDTLCFVEIKARSTRTFGTAIEAVTTEKRRRLSRAAARYLLTHPFAGPCRFDVLSMDAVREGWQFDLVRNAFELS